MTLSLRDFFFKLNYKIENSRWIIEIGKKCLGMKQSIVRIAINSIAWLFRDCTFMIRKGLAKGLHRRFGFGFKPKFKVTEEEKFLLGSDFLGKTVYDIGGYVGIHTLFFARAVGESGTVVTFEPYPENYSELKKNVELNRFTNVKLFPLGLGRSKGQVSFVIDPIYPSRGRVEEENHRVLDRGSRVIRINVDSLDNLMVTQRLPVPDFVKIDVEGYEMEVLDGMTKVVERYKPSLLIEVHGNLPKILSWLQLKGYAIHHIETGFDFEETIFPVTRGSHLYCQQID